jgi:hypothetical protein
MRIRRRYVIALAVALVAGIGSIVVPTRSDRLDPGARAQQAADALARRHLPEAMAALAHLTVPRDFRRITAGCRWYRCYVVPERTGLVAPELPGILNSIGAFNAQTRLLQARMQAAGAGCHMASNPREGTWTQCAYPSVLADNNVVVFLDPYFACHPGPCRWTNETEVDISQPSG